ncbi:MAG: hypothetical protein M1829_000817 [Trizodia sp. TS-e1964]|nr:MAG: hypothetical protein M1829_000817 [Trizodia sp. TS-e1964]
MANKDTPLEELAVAAAPTPLLSQPTTQLTPLGHAMRAHFLFSPSFTNLNHGSFGAFPRAVRTAMRRYQDANESQPDLFMRYTYLQLLDASRAALAALVNVPTGELVLTSNATMAVNIVLRNLVYAPNDAILYLPTAYPACEKTILYLAETAPVTAVKLAFPLLGSPSALVSAFTAAIKDTKARGLRPVVALIETIIASPGLRLPYEALVRACRAEGVLSLVDGAHGVGQIPLDLRALDADFFLSNCHKWLFTPRGCCLLHVPQRNHHLIRSALPTSHGFAPLNSTVASPLLPSSKPPFVTNFEFTGTLDNAPLFCIGDALRFRQSVCGGEEAIMAYCQTLARTGGAAALRVLGTEILGDEAARRCAFATLRLPLTIGANEAARVVQWMNRVMIDEYATFVAIAWFADALWARFSAQVYLETSDFAWGAKVLKELCARAEAGEWARAKL